MSHNGDQWSPPSRRQVLASVAGIATGTALSTPTAGQTAPTPTVMTQNVYVGVDLFEFAEADSIGQLLLTIVEALDTLDADRYAARAEGIALDIAAVGPDVVALQEVGLIERAGEDRETVIDVLAVLQSAIKRAQLGYDVAAETVTADIELSSGADQPGLRVANRDVLLVDNDRETANVSTGLYDAAETVAVPGDELTIQRGYCKADITVDDATLTVVGTHLESSSRSTRREQAEELLDVVPGDGPAVLAGDFNSGPGTTTDAYELLTAEFTDAFGTLNPDADGFTCCQAPDLNNEESQLDKRVDAVLVREATPTAAGRLGHEPDDRVTVHSGSNPVDLWPSDHAGVVATAEIETATPTPTPTPTQTATPQESPEPTPATESTPPTEATAATDGDGPGFGVGGALVAFGGLGYVLRGLRDE